ncbi:GNAT family N-acetyltransferase [Dehalococcoidia bacterium]|nr:GNAT family N-acetyltransferase [Dehalococcoidia bacterium]
MEGPRACRMDEVEEVFELINGTFFEGGDRDVRNDYPLVYDPVMLKYRRVVKEDGKVVAHVPVAPRKIVAEGDQFTIGLISATLTHPDYRHRGFATLCLRDCVRIMEEREWPISVLWTMERTFPFYQNSGWEAVASQGWVYTLSQKDLGLFGEERFEVVDHDQEDSEHLKRIVEMHDSEPNRVERSVADYKALLALPKTKTMLAMRGEAIVAYLVFGWSSNKPGIIEAGGSRAGVDALLGNVLEHEIHDGPTQALVPLTKSVLGTLLEQKLPSIRRPIEEAFGVGQQMHRINSLEEFLTQIQDHLQRKASEVEGVVSLMCSETGELVTLRFEGGRFSFADDVALDKIVLTRRELSRLIFGAHPSGLEVKIPGPPGKLLHGIFPYYFPIWEIDHC